MSYAYFVFTLFVMAEMVSQQALKTALKGKAHAVKVTPKKSMQKNLPCFAKIGFAIKKLADDYDTP